MHKPCILRKGYHVLLLEPISSKRFVTEWIFTEHHNMKKHHQSHLSIFQCLAQQHFRICL